MRSDCQQKYFDVLSVCARTTIKTSKCDWNFLSFLRKHIILWPHLVNAEKSTFFLCGVIFLGYTDAASGSFESAADQSVSTKSEHTSEPALPPCSASEYLSSLTNIVKSKKSKASKSPQRKKESDSSKRRKRSRSSSRKHKRKSRSRSRSKKRRSRSR